MLRNTYVDNCFYGADDVNDGLRFYDQSRNMFSSAKMNLTQFFSNSEEFNSKVTPKGEESQLCEQKLLGIKWNTSKDTLAISMAKPITASITKRRILQSISSNFDPIGLISPVVMTGKLFFQQLWSNSRNWDVILSEEKRKDWKKIEDGFSGEPLSITRKYFSTPTKTEDKYELHLFSDASSIAYGSVGYLRRRNSSSIETALVTAKGKLAPLKKVLTIPQLELLALEKSAQLADTLLKELDETIDKVYIWSDSLVCVDKLVRNNGDTVFTRNRLRSIHKLMPNAVFSHVPGKDNPADILSRGCTLEELRSHHLWWKGPSFLSKKNLPIRSSSIEQAITTLCVTKQPSTRGILNLDPNRFSSFKRLMNVVIRILRLLTKNVNEQALKEKGKEVVLRLAQDLHPPDEKTIENLQLQLIGDIWYYGGRIPERSVPYLPPHHVAKLFVMDIHRSNYHSSSIYTLAKVRDEVWITHGNSFVGKVINNCFTCKVLKARPAHQPDFPVLPNLRTQWNSPFTFVGLDYGGPLQALNNGEARKYWFVLFTCLTTRYTVVELVPSLDASHLLGIIRRFCATYGTPTEIRTDNAAQIRMLAAVTKEAENQTADKINSRLPTFRFIPALSPWSGGIYERMIGLIKNCLMRAGVTSRLMTEEDLRTLLKDSEGVVNARPLTVVSTTDIQPLRPVDFVVPGKRSTLLLTIEETLDPTPLTTSHGTLLEQWMRTSTLSEYFIKRWKSEYVQILLERNQTKHRQPIHTNHDPIKKGDIGMFKDENRKIDWPLARVEEVGLRAVQLFCPKTKRTVERPLKYVYPLEMDSSPISSDNESPVPVKTKTVPKYSPPVTRSQSKQSKQSKQALLTIATLSTLVSTAKAASLNEGNKNTV